MQASLDLETLCIFGAHLPWSAGPAPAPDPSPLADVVEVAAGDALADAVPPVAIALSGGVDSTVVAAALVRAGHRPRAFALDTGRAAAEGRATAAALGLPFEAVALPPGGIRGTSPLAVARALGQPTHSGAPFGFLPLYRALAARGVRTVFTGDGADEAFAGHAYHRDPPARWDPDIWPTWRAVRDLGVDADALLVARAPPWTASPAARRIADEVRALPDDRAGSAARLRWLDLRLRQGPQCVDLQRALATHCGLVYRAPLADARVTAAALDCPLDPARPKRPLTALAARWLGRPWRRAKQPMHTPTGGRALDEGWLRWLSDDVIERHGLFSVDAVRALVAGADPYAPWLPRALVVVATTHAGLEAGAFGRRDLRAGGDQLRGASSSK